jgi:hypothetical protein
MEVRNDPPGKGHSLRKLVMEDFVAQGEWTLDAVTRTLMNPRYCLSEPPVVAQAQWIEANAKLIAKMGPEVYF